MLRLFRAPDLAFWTLAVVVLAVLAVVAAGLGDGRDLPRDLPGVVAVPDATASAAAGHVAQLVALMPAGTAAGTDPDALSAWAGAVADVAGQAAATRASEGADGRDPLLAEVTRVGADADALAEAADDPVTATSWRTRIGLRVSRCALLVQGLPAPEVPAGPPGAVRHGQDPAAPSPADPPTPAVPEAPTGTAPTTVPTVPEE